MKGVFTQRIWELALSIPEGRVTTYGALAKAAGGGGQAARSVSSILGKYPNQGAIPWHRIVYAGGKVWLSPEHEEKRKELYALEDIFINEKGIIQDFEDIFYDCTGL
ncbi:MAG: methylated-DNA-protein-cysteine methyltransferase-like protein [Patiriisocius sp.]|jgi:methylated-DNA-protein-cysteine methyltransferase-like protein